MKKVKLLPLLMTLLLLCGCRETLPGSDGQSSQSHPGQESSLLTVYARQEYRYALQQVFSHISRTENSLNLQWADDQATADVVLTDAVPESQRSQYMVLNVEQLDTQGMDGLLLRTQEGVIGLPVFLRLDGFWYDRLLYSQNNMTVPQSAGAWFDCSLNGDYPAVCSSDSMDAVFWGVVAPLYIGCGGTEEELSAGTLRRDSLLPALEQLNKMVSENALVLTDEARERFTATGAAFWVTGLDQVAKYYNYKSNLSQWDISLSVPFDAQQKTQCIVRADMLLIRNTADPAAADRFLRLFYMNTMLTDLSEDTKMPMACQLRYTPSVVPGLAQSCYSALSSPAAQLRYVVCGWSEQKTKTVEAVLLRLLSGEIDAYQAAEQISED